MDQEEITQYLCISKCECNANNNVKLIKIESRTTCNIIQKVIIKTRNKNYKNGNQNYRSVVAKLEGWIWNENWKEILLSYDSQNLWEVENYKSIQGEVNFGSLEIDNS